VDVWHVVMAVMEPIAILKPNILGAIIIEIVSNTISVEPN
jgi:hypothetical protein